MSDKEEAFELSGLWDDDSTPALEVEEIEPTNPKDETDDNTSTEDEDIEKDDPIESEEPEEEEGTEEDNEEGTEDNEEDSSEEKNEPSEITAYYDYLVDVGAVLEDEEDTDFDGKEETLKERLEATLETRQGLMREEVLSEIEGKLSQEFIDLLNYGLAGGRSVEDFVETSITDFSEEDLENNLEAQKEIMKQYYQTQTRFGTDRINKEVQRLVDSGEIVNEVKDAYTAVNEFKETERTSKLEKIEEQAQEKKEVVKRQTVALQTQIESSSEIPNRAKQTYKKFILEAVDTEMGKATEFNYRLQKALSNPEHVIQLATILKDYDTTKGFELKTLTKKVKTQQAKSLKEKLKEAKKSDGKTKAGSSSQRDQRDLSVKTGSFSLDI